jgi:hypothetical protein
VRPVPNPVPQPAPKAKPAAKAKAKDGPSAKAWGCCLGIVLAVFGLVTWFVLATQNDGTTAPAISEAPIPSEAVIAPGTAPNLAPLALGSFPHTTDGKIAKQICEQWQGLRQEYVYRLTIDTPYQLNGWFSSSAWSKENNLANELDGDPAYSNLQGSLGVATIGDDASDANAALVDKACEKAD